MKYQVIFIFLLFLTPLFCQIPSAIPSSSAIAQASVACKSDWSAFHNPAMMANKQSSEIGLQYENRFIIPELSTKTIQANYHNNFLDLGFMGSYFGFSVYNEITTGINFAKNFSSKFLMAIQFNLKSSYVQSDNKYRSVFFPQLGFAYNFNPKFCLGFEVFNPFAAATDYSILDKRLGSHFSIGSSYAISPEFVWLTHLSKELDHNYFASTGIEYQLIPLCKFKLGAYYLDYFVPCIGLGLSPDRFLLNLNCELHPLLGLSPSIALKMKI